MTCRGQLQLKRDIVLISQDILSLVPFIIRMYICFEWPYKRGKFINEYTRWDFINGVTALKGFSYKKMYGLFSGTK